MIRAFIDDALMIDDPDAKVALVVTVGRELPDVIVSRADDCFQCGWRFPEHNGPPPDQTRCPRCDSPVEWVPYIQNSAPLIEPLVSLHTAGAVELRTTNGGMTIERATVRDENGDVVANLVNVPNAYDLALAWSKHVDARKHFDNVETQPSEQWEEWDRGVRPSILCRRIWREMAAAHDLVGATLDVELPVGLEVFCERCGWKGKDHAMIPPNAACPDCGKLFTVTECDDAD